MRLLILKPCSHAISHSRTYPANQKRFPILAKFFASFKLLKMSHFIVINATCKTFDLGAETKTMKFCCIKRNCSKISQTKNNAYMKHCSEKLLLKPSCFLLVNVSNSRDQLKKWESLSPSCKMDFGHKFCFKKTLIPGIVIRH